MGRKKKGSTANKRSNKTNRSNNGGGVTDGGAGHWMWVDPARVRFQHSRIRPVFSGCGRGVVETLDAIRRNEMAPSDLPPIQVIVGPNNSNESNDDEAAKEDGRDGAGPWYFSLNNRRLWVLKRCREEGLLENNQVRVRVRAPKSSAEAARYTIQNCALEAKLMREPPPSSLSSRPSSTAKNQQGNAVVVSSETDSLPRNGENQVKNKINDPELSVNLPCLAIHDDGDKEDHKNNNLAAQGHDGSSCQDGGDDDDDESSDDEPTIVGNRFSALF